MAEKKYMFNGVLREPKSDLERASVGNPGTKEMYASEIREALAQNRDDAKVKIPMRPKKQEPFKMDLEQIRKLINLKKIKDLQDKMNLEKNMAEGGIMRTGLKDGSPKYRPGDFKLDDYASYMMNKKMYYIPGDEELGTFDIDEVADMLEYGGYKKKAEGGIMRANYARGTDLEAGAQPITIEGDIRPDNMKMASESPEEELDMLRDIELLQEMKEFEEFKKKNPGGTYDDFKASNLISKKEISDLDLILKIMEIEGDDFGSATQKMQMYRRMEENKKNKPKDPGKKVRKIKLLAQGGLSSLLGE